MKLRRVMIAALKSGSGKTTVTCALLQALKQEGQQVVSYKCGPDYIDPMFHESVIGVPSRNLDTFFTDEEQTRKLFLKGMQKGSIAVLEGVMGVFDGLGGIREEGSSYHLAKITKTPVVLVADVKGMGRSILPLLAGFLSYDTEHLIRGILLNRISKGYYEVVKPQIETELEVPVLGYLPEKKELHMNSRHLGLVLPEKSAEIQKKLQAISEAFRETVSVERITDIAGNAEDFCLNGERKDRPAEERKRKEAEVEREKGGESGEYDCMGDVRTQAEYGKKTAVREKPVIAVARDEAFCFYYKDNLLLLEENGAEIQYFSPLHDQRLPDRCCALLIGGGYPELYARALSENYRMREAVRRAVKGGMPVVAECGGFMYLHSGITDEEGNSYAMAGVIPASCFYTGRLVRFGYVEIQERQSSFLPEGEKIRGHEFHYYDSTLNGEDAWAVKPAAGSRYPCVIKGETYWMGFPHLYYPSNPAFARQFVEKVKKYREVRRTEASYRFFENTSCKYFPCHSVAEHLNCLFCYCPLYLYQDCPGNPEYKEKDGQKIKVCTKCIFPHQPENYEKIIQYLCRYRSFPG